MTTRWGSEQIAAVDATLAGIQAWADGTGPLPEAESDRLWKALVYALKTGDPRLPALQAAFAALDTVWGWTHERAEGDAA